MQAALHWSEKGKVLFVDCGNAFNPYFITRCCRDWRKSKEVLQNILVSRPFTLHQAVRLFEKEMGKQAREMGAKSAVVFGLGALLGEEIAPEERKALVQRLVKRAWWLGKNLHMPFYFFNGKQEGFERWVGEANGPHNPQL